MSIDLGDNHTLTWAAYKDDPRSGASIAHLKADGTPCDGWIAIEGGAWAKSFGDGQIATWRLEQIDPVTLSPSVLCRVCGDHGHVRNGKWVRA